MSRTAASAVPVFRFDNFELDVRRRIAQRRRKASPPGPASGCWPSCCSPAATWSREELRNQLWPADTFVAFDHSLHNAIARVREALGDSAQTPTYIETLPRRGYRFIAPVEEVPPPSMPKDSYFSPYMLATIYAGLGETDAAFQLLGQAVQERNMDLAWSLPADPRMDTLRSDPRFKVLLGQVGFPR
jgi:Transcriptional regulatory protein, C terminal